VYVLGDQCHNTYCRGITVLLTATFMNEAVAKQLNTVDIDRKYKSILRLPCNETALDMDHFCTIKTIILIHIGHVAGRPD